MLQKKIKNVIFSDGVLDMSGDWAEQNGGWKESTNKHK